jgi:glycosyltransferase involved in cell wall biosynthesis
VARKRLDLTMKICLYSPYVPKHKGGGEKYLFDVATVLVKQGHHVSVAISSLKPLDNVDQIRGSYEEFLGQDLKQVAFIHSPIGTLATFIQKLAWTAQFDVLYYATDGSLFFSLARRNVLHIQIPFTATKKNFFERLKLWNWSIKNANSEFTRQVVEQSWQTPIPFVHQPMINLGVTHPEKIIEEKQSIILNVGRFFRQLHSKRQDVLVKMFKKLVDENPTAMKVWKLVLIGSVEDESYAQEVKELAKGYNIELIHQVTRAELNNWYKKAMIYWHATGYDVDEKANPEKVEHFGISTVEAMSYGCVPIVVGKGGQSEVLGYQLKDLTWEDIGEGAKKTYHIISHQDLRTSLATEAVQQADQFGEARFSSVLRKMIE